MQAKKIGLFGGSFDPIHFGHINLAVELQEKKQLDEVWFLPAAISPFKQTVPPISLSHRLAMVQLAIEKIPHFYVKEYEKELPTPSYTLHTIQTILEKEGRSSLHQFYLLMGEDTVPSFCNWYLPESIVQLVPLLIGSRTGIWQNELSTYSMSIREAIENGLMQTRLMDISSIEIRERIAQSRYVGHLMPASVIDYVEKNQLYRAKK